jgi:uncharacterized protein (DUF1800 family)
MAVPVADIFGVRFGYGRPLSGERADSPEALLEAAQQYASNLPPVSGNELASRLRKDQEFRQARAKARSEADRKQRGLDLQRWINSVYQEDAHSRLIEALTTPSPFHDRLTAFWVNHFTVSIAQPMVRPFAGLFEKQSIQPHVMGNFVDMLLAAEMHPAMMIYLDLSKSIGPNSPAGKKQGKGLNENLAREILELHTLGVQGGYNQTDVTEFAKIMTGWTVDRKRGEAAFGRFRAEPGSKTLLGETIGGDAPSAEDYAAALRRLAKHPSTHQFIAMKLVRHFIADQPPEQAVKKVASALAAADGNLPEAYRALLELPESAAPVGAKARTDFEFVTASLRAVQVEPEDVGPKVRKNGVLRPNPLSAGALNQMQQQLWAAPSPAGWPERADDWLAPSALAQRLRWIPQAVKHVKDKTPAAFLERVLGPLASERTRSVVTVASSREEALALVLASPEFNRR